MSKAEQSEISRDVVQRFFDAGAKGDFETALQLMDEDIVIHQPQFIAYGGTYRGRDNFPALAAKISEHLDMSASKIQLLVADGDTVFAVHHVPEVKTGKTCVLVVQITVRDGRLAENRIYFHEPQGLIRDQSSAT